MGISRPLDHRKKNCVVLSSQCVIWDGPDIPCINLCHGDSVEKVIYELATELCRILDLLNISTLDLSCFYENGCGPTDVNQLLQFILNKLCELSEDLEDLTENGFEFNCNLLSNCRVNVSCDSGQENLLPIYSSTGPNALSYFANQICDILDDIQDIQNDITLINQQITAINTTITNLQTTIGGLGFPAYTLNACSANSSIGPSGSQPANTPAPLITYVNNLAGQFCCMIGDIFGTNINNFCTYTPNIQFDGCQPLGLNTSQTFNSILEALTYIYSQFVPALCGYLENLDEELSNCCSGCAGLNSYNPLFLVTRVIRDGTSALPSPNQAIYSYQWLNSSEVPGSFTLTGLNIIARVFSGNPTVTSVPIPGVIGTGVNYFTVTCPSNDYQFNTLGTTGVNKYTYESKVYLIFEQTFSNGSVNCTKRFTIELDCPACNCGYVESLYASERAIPQIRDNRY